MDRQLVIILTVMALTEIMTDTYEGGGKRKWAKVVEAVCNLGRGS